MPTIQTKNLVKRFGGVNAIDGLSVSFEKGKITGIIGPNGSGKTTTTNVLSGVLASDGGDVFVNDVKFTNTPTHQVSSFGVTRTFQEVRLFEQMTVLDNILVVLTERNVFGSLFEKHSKFHLSKAEEVLKKVGLWEKKNNLASGLSYGQRKLLEVARVLSMNSDIYFFDEPFAGLFPEMRKIISSIIVELKQENKTVVLIEHDMGLIRELCDFVFVMDEGNLIAQGKPEEVLSDRKVVEAYLGE